jgi:ribosomal protein L14E/L6E/L27E
MKSEFQLADSIAKSSRANKDEKVHKNNAASATIEKCGPAAAVMRTTSDHRS